MFRFLLLLTSLHDQMVVVQACDSYVTSHISILSVYLIICSTIVSLCGRTLSLLQESLHTRHLNISFRGLENRELDTKRIRGLTAVLKDGKT